MGTMVDSTNPANIPAEYHGKPAVRTTVLADPAGEVFDLESDNAPADQVAAAVAVKVHQGGWAVVYADEPFTAQAVQALAAKELRFANAEAFPAAGVYLGAADWTHTEHLQPEWAPVHPVFCQFTNGNEYDTSVTADNFPAEVLGYIDGPDSEWPADAWAAYVSMADALGSDRPPTPGVTPPPTPAADTSPQHPQIGVCTVQLPVLEQGNQGPAVRAAQTLVGGLVQDGIFGPATHEGVVRFQADHGLAQDGIVGQHTWGALLGAPQ